MAIRALVLSILVTVFALPVAAQQAAGKWNASIDTPQGPFAFVFEFIVDAAGKLTGSMQNEFIGTAPITDGVLKGTDLSSLRAAFCGAEPVSARTMRAFLERFATYGFDARALTPVYGLAENTLGLTFSPLGRGMRVDRISRAQLAASNRAVPAAPNDDVLELVSCGAALPGNTVRIVDMDGRDVPERVAGRIEFRSPSATSGYYRNVEQTGRLIRDGWLDTGDIGYLADGELFITGRVVSRIS